MKTPEEVIWEWTKGYFPDSGERRFWLGTSVIEALDAAGYAVVPKEPTEEMLGAAQDEEPMIHLSHFYDIWSAMLAAATKKADQPEG